MTSETKAADKPGDPADKAADGAFGGVHSHRAGYGDDKLARLVDYLRQRPSATLASGEGALLLAEIDRLRVAAKDSADHYADARAEIDRLRRILAALREPSEGVVDAMENWLVWTDRPYMRNAIRAAVAAAEQEVGRE